jgi:tetratricopeptide (TPR) repeat protein
VLTAGWLCHEGGRIRNDIFVSLAGLPGEFACELTWVSHEGPAEAVALLAIVDPAWPRVPPPTARWGQFTGHGGWLLCDAAVPVVAADPGEPVSGRIGPFRSPLTGLLDFKLEDGADRAEQASDMLAGGPCLAGAAVLHNGLIVGVMPVGVSDTVHGSAAVVPATKLIGDESFADKIAAATKQTPQTESLELSPVLAPWPVPAPRTPADLLRPELATVRFAGRHRELDELTAWCEAATMSAAHLVVGDHGTGKTRLARELAARLHRSGWITGCVARLSSTAYQALAQASRPIMLIIDEAEARADVSSLISHIVTRPPGPPIRCLVLAHHVGEWWTELVASAPGVSAVFANRPMLLSAPVLDGESAHDAARDLAGGLSRLPGYSSADWAARVTLAARQSRRGVAGMYGALEAILAALLAGDPEGAECAADVLLAHEERRWEAVARQCDLDPAGVRLAAAVAHCCEPATSDDADKVLARLPALGGDAMRPARQRLAGWLASIWLPAQSGTSAWGPFLPGPLAARHLARTLNRDSLGGLFRALDGPEATRALIVLTDAGAEHSDAARSLGSDLTAVIGANPRLLGPAAAAAVSRADEPGPLVRALTALMQSPELDLSLARDIAHAMPTLTGTANDVAVVAHERLIELLRDAAGSEAGRLGQYLAPELMSLARRLASAGRRNEAAAAAREAVQLYENLAATSDAAFHPAWAAALLDLAEWLGEDAAASVRAQAIELYRELAGLDPRRFLPDLAASLLRRGRDADPVSAAAAVSESGDIYRRLCRQDPARFQPAFADALAEQVRADDRLNRPDLAISAVGEIVEIYASLSMTHPAAYLDLHAAALDSLAERCAEQGDSAAALTASESAVAVRRRLASERPDAHVAGLADALRRLSEHLGSSGWVAQARVVSAEDILWCRMLDQRRSQHQARLASALCTNAVWLGALGNWEGCRSALQEAVDLYRQLGAEQPGRHEAELAVALTNLGVSLGEQLRSAESLQAAQEAVDLYRRIAADQPGRHEAELAVAMTNLAVNLGENNCHDLGAAAAAEAVSWLRSPETESGDEDALAAAQLTLARELGALGRYAPAVEAATGAVRMLRAHAGDGDQAHARAFAASASYLAQALTATGQYDDALAHANQAVDLFRQLDAARPERHSLGMTDALLRLSECQARLGLAAQARSCAEESVALRHVLAETDPVAFRVPLVDGLSVLTARLEEDGDWALANQAGAEAVELYRQMTGMQARTHRHAFVMALCAHAGRLSRSGMEGPVDVATEALWQARAPSSDADTAILLLDEAEASTTLAECLRAVSQRAASRAAARDAAGSCLRDVQLSATGPAFEASARTWLADRLCTLSARLYNINALSDSLTIVRLAERLCRSIGDPEFDARYGLARSLELRAAVLCDLARRRQAARAAEEAVALYRLLATKDPMRFREQLARALGTLARSESLVKARRLRAEAAAIRSGVLRGAGP